MPMNAWLSKRGKLCHGRQFGLHPDEVQRLLGAPTPEEIRRQEREAQHAETRKAFAEDQARIRAKLAAKREQKRYEELARLVHEERIAAEQQETTTK